MSDPVSFASTTPRFELPLLFAAQAQKEAFVNEALARIDAVLHPAVLGERSAPPTAPGAGSSWIVGPDAIADWTGEAGKIAVWSGAQWLFVAPREGMACRDLSTGAVLVYSEGWQRTAAPALPTGGDTVDAECRAAVAAIVGAFQTLGIFSV